jgi:hypothetical protein
MRTEDRKGRVKSRLTAVAAPSPRGGCRAPKAGAKSTTLAGLERAEPFLRRLRRPIGHPRSHRQADDPARASSSVALEPSSGGLAGLSRRSCPLDVPAAVTFPRERTGSFGATSARLETRRSKRRGKGCVIQCWGTPTPRTTEVAFGAALACEPLLLGAPRASSRCGDLGGFAKAAYQEEPTPECRPEGLRISSPKRIDPLWAVNANPRPSRHDDKSPSGRERG